MSALFIGLKYVMVPHNLWRLEKLECKHFVSWWWLPKAQNVIDRTDENNQRFRMIE